MKGLRVVIVGGPKAGKTTAATRFGIRVKHTDDIKGLPWAESSLIVSDWMNLPGSWVIEGVTTARALRKWLKNNPEGRPCDQCILVTGARLQLTREQEAMRKGVETVWQEIKEELDARGVDIVETNSVGRELMRGGLLK